MRILLLLFCFYCHLSFLYGQTDITNILTASYKDSVKIIVDLYPSLEEKYLVFDFLSRYQKCKTILCWLELNSFDLDSRSYLLNTIRMINADPEYVLERFLELYEEIKKNPNYLLENFGVFEEVIENDGDK